MQSRDFSRTGCLFLFVALYLSGGPLATDWLLADEPNAGVATAAKAEQLVPQNLLGLVHAPEVQADLKLSPEQTQQLEALFGEIDGPWFRARIQPPETQLAIIKDLEGRVRKWFGENGSKEQVRRLNQIEVQSFGARALLADKVARAIQMDAAQQAKVLDLARITYAATQHLQEAVKQNQNVDEATEALRKAVEQEQQAFVKVLRPEQLEKLMQLVGPTLDTSKLSRIYPMAPEFVSVDEWINSGPLTLAQLRGKVVLVHFYAFQCHNCHANFDHYTKWAKEFGDRVVVIGIQTPETSAERDPARVRQAARDKGMTYPVMIDLESKNWQAWANTMWPTVYVIDQDGYLRHWWQGELNWQGATADQVVRDVVKGLLERAPRGT